VSKCLKLFSWQLGSSFPRLNGIFKTMKESNSEKLYIFKREDVDYIGFIVGAHSRQEAIDFIYRFSRINGKPIYSVQELQRRIKLWVERKDPWNEFR